MGLVKEIIMRKLSCFIPLLLCLLATKSEAVLYTDNFEYPQPSGNAWTSVDGIFTHTISNDAIWAISGDPTNPRMILSQGHYTVDFNLLPGQSVNYISFNFTINELYSTNVRIYAPDFMHVIGICYDSPSSTFDSDLEDIDVQGACSMTFYSSPDMDIMDVGLTLDNISINIVPEPSSILLLGLSSLAVLRKNSFVKRKRELKGADLLCRKTR